MADPDRESILFDTNEVQRQMMVSVEDFISSDEEPLSKLPNSVEDLSDNDLVAVLSDSDTEEDERYNTQTLKVTTDKNDVKTTQVYYWHATNI